MRSQWITAAVAATFVAGCHNAKPSMYTPPAATPAGNPAPPPPPRATPRPAPVDSSARVRARADSLRRVEDARAAAIREANVAAHVAIAAQVYFDFDRSELRDQDKATLDRKLNVLRANPALSVRIEGNTDERGSNEYNIALGSRRAAIAKQYLIDRGIDASRLEVVSNGEEKKVCTDHAESCWSQNRRDEFVITAGDGTLSNGR